MLDDVDRMEVIRGPGATIWGPNAVNGVINIIAENSRQSRLRGSYAFLHMNIGKAPQSKDVGSFPAIIGSSPQHEADVQSSFDFSKAFQLI